MPLTTELWIKGTLSLLALLLVAWQEFRPAKKNRTNSRRAPSLYILLALVAVGAYFNFGSLHGRSAIHHWEQFHYVLGSKYFHELGYDGLYVASLEAQIESQGATTIVQPDLRDLRSNEVVRSATLEAHRREVRGRFSAERWAEFVSDNRYFVVENDANYLANIRRDHGYNPPPSWTFVARLASAWLPVRGWSLVLLSWIDPLLLALALVVIYRTFGGRITCLVMMILALGYAWRFDWVGGAFLRQDWLAAWLIGICQLKTERYARAGALFAYAAVVRIFPVLFLFPLGVVAARELVKTRRSPWALAFALGFGAVVVGGLAAGSLTGRGVSAWSEFGDNLERHSGTWLTNNVGAENLLIYDGAIARREAVDFSLPEPWIDVQRTIESRREARRPWIWLGAGAILLLVGLAAWGEEPWRAATLGPAVVFALVSLTCYYWAMLAVAPLWSRRGRVGWNSPTTWVLLLGTVLFGVHLRTPSFEAIFGLMSWALAALFVAWTLPSALARLS